MKGGPGPALDSGRAGHKAIAGPHTQETIVIVATRALLSDRFVVGSMFALCPTHHPITRPRQARAGEQQSTSRP